MACINSKNFHQFHSNEEPEEEENEDNNIDQIINRLQSKLCNSSKNIQNVPNKLNTDDILVSKSITPPQKLIRTLMSNQIINNNKSIIINNNNSKINSSNNSNINKTTEKNDEIYMSSIVSGYSISKNIKKISSTSLSVNVSLPSEAKNDIENKNNIQIIIENMKTTHQNTTSNIINSQIDSSKFILNKYNRINEILKSKKFQKESENNKESKNNCSEDKINELVNDKNQIDENLCKKGQKTFKRKRFYKCIILNYYSNYNLRNIFKCCRNFNTITFIRNIFILTVIISAVSFYMFLILYN